MRIQNIYKRLAGDYNIYLQDPQVSTRSCRSSILFEHSHYPEDAEKMFDDPKYNRNNIHK